MNRFVRQPSLLIIMAACPCGVQGQVGERKLDAVPLFSGDAAHWTVSVPPGFPPESRMTALAGGQEGWVIGTGIVPGQVGPSFTNLPTGFLTGNGAMGGYFVAVGDGGEIAISTNGINWATVRSGGGPFVDNGLNEIIEFKGHAYAVGEGGLIVSSPVNNLSNWTVVAGRSKQRRFEIGTFEQGLNHDGTDFIAVSNNQYDFALFSSPDGETWTLEAENTTGNISSNSVSGGGITLYLGNRIGSNGAKLFRYQNGHEQANNTPFSGSQSAGYVNGHFFLNTLTNLSGGGAECEVYTSADGLNWTRRLTIPLSVGGNYSRDPVEVVFTGTHYYVAFFSDFWATAAHVYRSTDLAGWSALSANLPP